MACTRTQDDETMAALCLQSLTGPAVKMSMWCFCDPGMMQLCFSATVDSLSCESVFSLSLY